MYMYIVYSPVPHLYDICIQIKKWMKMNVTLYLLTNVFFLKFWYLINWPKFVLYYTFLSGLLQSVFLKRQKRQLLWIYFLSMILRFDEINIRCAAIVVTVRNICWSNMQVQIITVSSLTFYPLTILHLYFNEIFSCCKCRYKHIYSILRPFFCRHFQGALCRNNEW